MLYCSCWRGLSALLTAAVLALTPATAAAAQNRPEPLKRVRVLLMIDPNPNRTAAGKTDRDGLVDLLQRTVPPANLDLVVFEGEQATPENVLEHYRNLQTGPDDCLFFFYSGHGGWHPERGHLLSPGKPSRLLYRADLLAAMRGKNAGLVVCLTSCCSNFIESRDQAPPRLRGGRAESLAPVMQHLFFQHRGVVDITAAEPGTYGYNFGRLGSVFTRALLNLLDKPLGDLDLDRDGFVSWAELYRQLHAETNAVLQTWQERGGVPPEERKTQFPYAFQIPAASARPPAGPHGYRLGARVQAAAQGMKIEQVTPGSPAARLGLEAGDVILSVNGRPVRNAADYARSLDQGGGRVRLEILDARSGKVVIRDNVMLGPVP
jgi:hypothetical protein